MSLFKPITDSPFWHSITTRIGLRRRNILQRKRDHPLDRYPYLIIREITSQHIAMEFPANGNRNAKTRVCHTSESRLLMGNNPTLMNFRIALEVLIDSFAGNIVEGVRT